MPLTIRTTRMQREEEQSMGMYKAPAKLWLTEDHQRVVEDGHSEAAFLFLAEGHEIPEDEAAKYGLVKRAQKPADKAVTKPADKAGAKPKDK